MGSKIIYLGTPEFAVAPLKAILDAGHDVCAVVTAPDKPTGRGLQISESAVKTFAKERGLNILQPLSLKEKEFTSILKGYDAHLFVVVAFRMLPREVWSIPRFGTFNLHASLLPDYRGAAPINHAIINGERVTGVTTFMIDEKIDTGEIIARRECEITENDNAGTLHDKLMDLGSGLVTETIELIISGKAEMIPQSKITNQNRTLKEAPKLTKETGLIDWCRSATDIFNLIRGLSPYPAAYSTMQNSSRELSLKIYSAIPEIPGDTLIFKELKPGEIDSDNKTYLRVGCLNGSVKLTSIQAAGKKRLEIRDFLAGIRDIGSYKFV